MAVGKHVVLIYYTPAISYYIPKYVDQLGMRAARQFPLKHGDFIIYTFDLYLNNLLSVHFTILGVLWVVPCLYDFKVALFG